MVTLPRLSFGTAVKTCLSKYATFTGRARRSEYWWFFLFLNIIFVVVGLICGVLAVVTQIQGFFYLIYLVGIALLLPSLAVCVRRLHDIGKSGWWVLIKFIPLIGDIVMLIFCVEDSQPEANQYGPSPKYVTE